MAKRTCSEPDCGRPHFARGWCRSHYHVWWKDRDPSEPLILTPRKIRAPWTPPPLACGECGLTFQPKATNQRFCSPRCNYRNRDRRRLACSVCARPMWAKAGQSRPQGTAICNPCRRLANPPGPKMRNCVTCGEPATIAHKRYGWYCDYHRAIALAKRRERADAYAAAKSSKERGYGQEHKRLRKQWAASVEAGEVRCARCGYWIEPGSPWDLDHQDEDRTRYLGPSHAKCNRATSAHRAQAKDARRTRSLRIASD